MTLMSGQARAFQTHGAGVSAGELRHTGLRASPGRAVQVAPIKTTLKAPGTKRLKL